MTTGMTWPAVVIPAASSAARSNGTESTHTSTSHRTRPQRSTQPPARPAAATARRGGRTRPAGRLVRAGRSLLRRNPSWRWSVHGADPRGQERRQLDWWRSRALLRSAVQATPESTTRCGCDLPITRRMFPRRTGRLQTDLPAQVDGSSVQTAPDGYRRIVWMIIGMIKQVSQLVSREVERTIRPRWSMQRGARLHAQASGNPLTQPKVPSSSDAGRTGATPEAAGSSAEPMPPGTASSRRPCWAGMWPSCSTPRFPGPCSAGKPGRTSSSALESSTRCRGPGCCWPRCGRTWSVPGATTTPVSRYLTLIRSSRCCRPRSASQASCKRRSQRCISSC